MRAAVGEGFIVTNGCRCCGVFAMRSARKEAVLLIGYEMSHHFLQSRKLSFLPPQIPPSSPSIALTSNRKHTATPRPISRYVSDRHICGDSTASTIELPASWTKPRNSSKCPANSSRTAGNS